jgi:hypothetical protein
MSYTQSSSAYQLILIFMIIVPIFCILYSIKYLFVTLYYCCHEDDEFNYECNNDNFEI